MSGKTNDNSNVSAMLSSLDLPHDDSFIDDYSHLRLSYYQVRGDFEETLSSGGGETQYTNHSNLNDPSVNTTCDTIETEVSSIHDDLKRSALREYYVSQIPDLPPPSFTVASIIASASNRMNSGNIFKYESEIEHGKKYLSGREEEIFSPSRRSTLKPIAKK